MKRETIREKTKRITKRIAGLTGRRLTVIAIIAVMMCVVLPVSVVVGMTVGGVSDSDVAAAPVSRSDAPVGIRTSASDTVASIAPQTAANGSGLLMPDEDELLMPDDEREKYTITFAQSNPAAATSLGTVAVSHLAEGEYTALDSATGASYSVSELLAGDKLRLKITPTSGKYSPVSVTITGAVSGAKVELTDEDLYRTYDFTMPAEDITISVVYYHHFFEVVQVNPSGSPVNANGDMFADVRLFSNGTYYDSIGHSIGGNPTGLEGERIKLYLTGGQTFRQIWFSDFRFYTIRVKAEYRDPATGDWMPWTSFNNTAPASENYSQCRYTVAGWTLPNYDMRFTATYTKWATVTVRNENLINDGSEDATKLGYVFYQAGENGNVMNVRDPITAEGKNNITMNESTTLACEETTKIQEYKSNLTKVYVRPPKGLCVVTIKTFIKDDNGEWVEWLDANGEPYLERGNLTVTPQHSESALGIDLFYHNSPKMPDKDLFILVQYDRYPTVELEQINLLDDEDDPDFGTLGKMKLTTETAGMFASLSHPDEGTTSLTNDGQPSASLYSNLGRALKSLTITKPGNLKLVYVKSQIFNNGAWEEWKVNDEPVATLENATKEERQWQFTDVKFPVAKTKFIGYYADWDYVTLEQHNLTADESSPLYGVLGTVSLASEPKAFYEDPVVPLSSYTLGSSSESASFFGNPEKPLTSLRIDVPEGLSVASVKAQKKNSSGEWVDWNVISLGEQIRGTVRLNFASGTVIPKEDIKITVNYVDWPVVKLEQVNLTAAGHDAADILGTVTLNTGAGGVYLDPDSKQASFTVSGSYGERFITPDVAATSVAADVPDDSLMVVGIRARIKDDSGAWVDWKVDGNSVISVENAVKGDVTTAFESGVTLPDSDIWLTVYYADWNRITLTQKNLCDDDSAAFGELGSMSVTSTSTGFYNEALAATDTFAISGIETDDAYSNPGEALYALTMNIPEGTKIVSFKAEINENGEWKEWDALTLGAEKEGAVTLNFPDGYTAPAADMRIIVKYADWHLLTLAQENISNAGNPNSELLGEVTLKTSDGAIFADPDVPENSITIDDATSDVTVSTNPGGTLNELTISVPEGLRVVSVTAEKTDDSGAWQAWDVITLGDQVKGDITLAFAENTVIPAGDVRIKVQYVDWNEITLKQSNITDSAKLGKVKLVTSDNGLYESVGKAKNSFEIAAAEGTIYGNPTSEAKSLVITPPTGYTVISVTAEILRNGAWTPWKVGDKDAITLTDAAAKGGTISFTPGAVITSEDVRISVQYGINVYASSNFGSLITLTANGATKALPENFADLDAAHIELLTDTKFSFTVDTPDFYRVTSVKYGSTASSQTKTLTAKNGVYTIDPVTSDVYIRVEVERVSFKLYSSTNITKMVDLTPTGGSDIQLTGSYKSVGTVYGGLPYSFTLTTNEAYVVESVKYGSTASDVGEELTADGGVYTIDYVDSDKYIFVSLKLKPVTFFAKSNFGGVSDITRDGEEDTKLKAEFAEIVTVDYGTAIKFGVTVSRAYELLAVYIGDTEDAQTTELKADASGLYTIPAMKADKYVYVELRRIPSLMYINVKSNYADAVTYSDGKVSEPVGTEYEILSSSGDDEEYSFTLEPTDAYRIVEVRTGIEEDAVDTVVEPIDGRYPLEFIELDRYVDIVTEPNPIVTIDRVGKGKITEGGSTKDISNTFWYVDAEGDNDYSIRFKPSTDYELNKVTVSINGGAEEIAYTIDSLYPVTDPGISPKMAVRPIRTGETTYSFSDDVLTLKDVVDDVVVTATFAKVPKYTVTFEQEGFKHYVIYDGVTYKHGGSFKVARGDTPTMRISAYDYGRIVKIEIGTDPEHITKTIDYPANGKFVLDPVMCDTYIHILYEGEIPEKASEGSGTDDNANVIFAVGLIASSALAAAFVYDRRRKTAGEK